MHVGEIYNGRYHVLAKLGWGHFSTVWLCQDGVAAIFSWDSRNRVRFKTFRKHRAHMRTSQQLATSR